MSEDFQARINYPGKLRPLMSQVCEAYKVGDYIDHKIIATGYEDLNLILETYRGKFFIKIFSAFRNENECINYISVMLDVVNAGINHPKLYKSQQGYLYKKTLDNVTIRLCLMQYIDGESLYEIKVKPNLTELKSIIKQASLINSLKLKPKFTYDSWAIFNFLKEYKQKNKFLNDRDAKTLSSLMKAFSSFDLSILPNCFVHGDLIKTNILRDIKDNIYIIDFSVANYYPRIEELAVLLNDTFFDKDSFDRTKEYYYHVLEQYQRHIYLTALEIENLPLFIKVGHAMHVLRANYEKVVNDNNSQENEYFLKLGRVGLEYSNKLWGE